MANKCSMDATAPSSLKNWWGNKKENKCYNLHGYDAMSNCIF
jgi:hypothetical protein